jgi:hypothetical protein
MEYKVNYKIENESFYSTFSSLEEAVDFSIELVDNNEVDSITIES